MKQRNSQDQSGTDPEGAQRSSASSTETSTAAQREVPPMPGGGRWRFDTDAWAWVSNDPVEEIKPGEPT